MHLNKLEEYILSEKLLLIKFKYIKGMNLNVTLGPKIPWAAPSHLFWLYHFSWFVDSDRCKHELYLVHYAQALKYLDKVWLQIWL